MLILNCISYQAWRALPEARGFRGCGKTRCVRYRQRLMVWGNAPGMRVGRPSAVKGSYYPKPRDAEPAGRRRDLTLSGSEFRWAHVYWRHCPRLLTIPCGD